MKIFIAERLVRVSARPASVTSFLRFLRVQAQLMAQAPPVVEIICNCTPLTCAGRTIQAVDLVDD